MTSPSSDVGRGLPLGLQSAINQRDVERVRQLLAEGAEPNGPRRFPLLHRSIKHGALDIVRMLVDAGADIERVDHAGWTPLTRADADERAEIIDFLLDAGADPSALTRHGFAPLHRAVRAGDPTRCSLLLGKGADVNARSADGSTALLLAARTCDTTLSELLLRTLLDHQADPDLGDDDGWVPLAWAAYEDAAHADFGGDRIVRVPQLLQAGADPNAGTYPPLLSSLSEEGRTWAVTDMLIRAGANPDAVDDLGTTLLLRALQVTTDGEFIVRCAAVVSDVTPAANDGTTPVDEALARWSSDPTGEDSVDPLLALRSAGVDLSVAADQIPGWLREPGDELSPNAPPDATLRFGHLRRVFRETRDELRT